MIASGRRPAPTSAAAGRAGVPRPAAAAAKLARRRAAPLPPGPRHVAPSAAAAGAAGTDAAAMAAEWLRLDRDAASRASVEAMVAGGDEAALRDLFCQRLEFGTAGLRGKMGPGFSRMNAVTVQQSTQGLCRYLQSQSPELLKAGGVLLGYDARHNSRDFAEVAAKVFLSQGVPVALFPRITPTPFVAFGTKELGCAAGVMITASHNTKEYNGYKVYWSNGCQIIPPLDSGIAAAIEANLDLWDLSTLDLARAASDGLLTDPLEAVARAYYARISERLVFRSAQENGAAAPVVYTPLHGVGLEAVRRAFSTFSLPQPAVVAAQAQPDPEFTSLGPNPPNPEEGKGVWTLAYETAAAAGASVVLANDPDADRLAAAEADSGSSGGGGYSSFSGNDIGLLLADWVWTNFRHRSPEVPPAKVAMLSTAVSSKALAAMAEAEGFKFVETLTGFKWLGNVAAQLEAEGYTVLFAYEEAIGFMFNAIHKDKDGVSAAAAFAEMAAALARRGTTVRRHLAALHARYGPRAYLSGYFVADPPAKAAGVFEDLRRGGAYPKQVGGVAVTGVRDMGVGVDTTQPDGKPSLPWSPGDLMLTLYLEGGSFLTLRASATEPKLKYYLECAAASGEAPEAAEARARAVEAAVARDIVRPEERGLGVRAGG
ncbi:phosphoglucomutase [Raphidocelis subcapitata]|uniref:phosphoglucomutase (alpha-D-glucose-1,6-bisphosphate-dependent) n=1 Tax=Raphidocelis subcapitata TaxID=307507 RepID=A0A2V0PC93_9CHLO|nr:phosphoglucomutase [Raphidocelis subcapitata]|eukprot:GBF95500.1 phosphoglucomutase [Raphidocelis subcapitata]